MDGNFIYGSEDTQSQVNSMAVNIFTSITPNGSCIYEAKLQCLLILVKSNVSALIELVNMFYELFKKKTPKE